MPRGGLQLRGLSPGSPELAGPVALLAGTNLQCQDLSAQSRAVSQTSPVLLAWLTCGWGDGGSVI